MEFTFFANKKYVLTASYSFYILMHLFGILVILYNVVGWRVGSDAASCCACESSEAHGCESWSSLLITVWKALSSSELVQLHFILAVPQAAWLIRVQDNDSWEALCGPWLWSRLADLSLLWCFQGMLVYHHPCGSVLLDVCGYFAWHTVQACPRSSLEPHSSWMPTLDLQILPIFHIKWQMGQSQEGPTASSSTSPATRLRTHLFCVPENFQVLEMLLW